MAVGNFPIRSKVREVNIICGRVVFGASGAVSDDSDLEGASMVRTAPGVYTITLDEQATNAYAQVSQVGNIPLVWHAPTAGYQASTKTMSMDCYDMAGSAADPGVNTKADILIVVKETSSP